MGHELTGSFSARKGTLKAVVVGVRAVDFEDPYSPTVQIVHESAPPVEIALPELPIISRVDFYFNGEVVASCPFAIGVGHWLYIPPQTDDSEQ